MEDISTSNLKQLLDYVVKNKKNINIIINYYKPNAGYIYCLYNNIFNYYGDDVYKFGNSINPDQRCLQYTTSYLEPCELKKMSNKYFDKNFAETLLFHYLKDYRINGNREFFQCDKNIYEDAFEKVDIFFEKYNTSKLLFEHLLKDNIYLTYYSIGATKNLKNNYNNMDKIAKSLDIEIKDYDNFENELTDHVINLSNEDFYNFYNNISDDNNDYRYIFDKINSLFILEKKLNINRYEIKNIEKCDIDDINNFLLQNMENIFIIFKNNEAKTKTLNSIRCKIDIIKNENYLQKFMAECYNKVLNNDIFNIKYYRKKINKKVFNYYQLTKN
jgi:hypothetical protein